MIQTLENKTALITGASRGIGAAIAEEFVGRGARVVLIARSGSVLKFAERLRTAGHIAEAVVGDVTNDADVRSLVQLCRARFGGIDVLVNNAGILVSGKLGMLRLDDARRMFEVNIIAVINLTQYAVRAFPRERGGSIINLASIAGTQGIDGLTSYSASKAAVIGFTKAAAKELASRRIRVNAIAPGFIDTDMARQMSPEWFQERIAGIRMGRIGLPAEIARCAAFLATDESLYVTGQVIGVNGGMVV